MNQMITVAVAVLIFAAGPKPPATPLTSSSSPALAEEIAKKSHLAVYYAGKDNIGESTMTIREKDGKERVREMAGMRLDIEDGGDQKYYVYFRKPSDVSRLSYVVHKNADADDTRWIYIPSVDLIKPIVADDKTQSFVGSDFSYEDISGRHWSQDTHKLIGEETYEGKQVLLLESVPKKAYPGYDKKLSRIDKTNFIALKMEFFRSGKLTKIGLSEKIETVQDIITVTRFSMEDVLKGRKTVISMSQLKYDVGLKSDLFTERYLKAPPREFVK